jgi:hypothetical protein
MARASFHQIAIGSDGNEECGIDIEALESAPACLAFNLINIIGGNVTLIHGSDQISSVHHNLTMQEDATDTTTSPEQIQGILQRSLHYVALFRFEIRLPTLRTAQQDTQGNKTFFYKITLSQGPHAQGY